MSFYLLKTYIRNHSLFFISFFTLKEMLMATTIGGDEFCQVSIFAKLVYQTARGQFFLFYQKLDECQVDLPNS
jgi:hypothetical protein